MASATDRPPPRRQAPEVRGVNLDGHAIGQVDRLARLALDHAREHRNALEEPQHLAEDHAGLATVRGNGHHRSALAGSEALRVVAEGREIDSDETSDARFPATTPDYDPGFLRRRARGRSAPRVAAVGLKSL